MTTHDLESLIERVKAATGPDRELDRVLSEAFGVQNDHGVLIVADRWLGIAPFTESVDVVLYLVERVLPEANCMGVEKDVQHGWSAYVSRNNVASGHWLFEQQAKSAPLALLTALLLAKLSLTKGTAENGN